MELSASEERDRTVVVVPDASSSLPFTVLALKRMGTMYDAGQDLREPILPAYRIGRAEMNWRHEEPMAIVNQPVIMESYSDAEFSRDARTARNLYK